MNAAAASPARIKGDTLFDGVDLAAAIDLMLALPSARSIDRVAEVAIRRSKVHGDVSGHACFDMRVTITIGYDATVHNVLGTLLHEIAHLGCMAADEPSSDGAREFAIRCHALHDEWNLLHADVALVDAHITGAYRGPLKMDASQAVLPARKPGAVAPVLAPSIKDEEWADARYWGRIKEAAASHRRATMVEINVGGYLANEIQAVYVDTFEDDGSDPGRLHFVEAWEQARTVRSGSGSAEALRISTRRIMELWHAMDWAIDLQHGKADCARASRQAARVTERVLKALDLPIR